MATIISAKILSSDRKRIQLSCQMDSSQPPGDLSTGVPLEPSRNGGTAQPPRKPSRIRSLHSGVKSASAPAANAKVPIPRQRSGVEVRYSRRVAKACESCRQRKTKCSGDTPVCRQCRELRISCHYPDGMREKTKRYRTTLRSDKFAGFFWITIVRSIVGFWRSFPRSLKISSSC